MPAHLSAAFTNSVPCSSHIIQSRCLACLALCVLLSYSDSELKPQIEAVTNTAGPLLVNCLCGWSDRWRTIFITRYCTNQITIFGLYQVRTKTRDEYTDFLCYNIRENMMPPLSSQHRNSNKMFWLFAASGETWTSCFSTPHETNPPPNSKCSFQEAPSSISAGRAEKSSKSMCWTWGCWFRGTGKGHSQYRNMKL